jgi:hypothetical protein
MHKTCSLLLAAALAAGALREARALVMDTSFDAEARVAGANVWRGRILNDEPCFQPAAAVHAMGFNLALWGTWDLTDVSNNWENTRMDVTLDCTLETDYYTLRPGLTAYVYRDDMEGRSSDTFEAFVKAALNCLLLPSLTVCYDFADLRGFYVAAGVAHSVDLVEGRLALDLRADIGWADENYIAEWFGREDDEQPGGIVERLPGGPAPVDLTASLALPWSLGGGFTLTPAVRYMGLLDADLRDAVESVGKDESEVVWSLSLAARF